MAETVKHSSLTIASGADVSSSIRLDHRRLTGIIWPATMTNTAMDVQLSDDNGTTWYNISSLTAIPVTASTLESLDPADTINAHFIRLKGASTEGSARTVKILSQPTV